MKTHSATVRCFRDNSSHLQGDIEEEKGKEKINAQLPACLGVPSASKRVLAFFAIPNGRNIEELMENPDSYGDWLLHDGCEANATTPPAANQALRAAARAGWPRVLAHATLELRNKNSQAEALAA